MFTLVVKITDTLVRLLKKYAVYSFSLVLSAMQIQFALFLYHAFDMRNQVDLRRFLKQEARTVRKLLRRMTFNASDEQIHDLRVGLRRIRTVLQIMKDNHVKHLTGKNRKILRKIWRRLGDARDLDVAVELAQNYQFPVEDIEERRKKANSKMIQKLNDPKIMHLVRAFKKLSRDPSLKKINTENTIQRLKDELIETSKFPDDLHALRITLKKVRYFLEALNKDVEPFKKYQDILGEVNDLKMFLSFHSDETTQTEYAKKINLAHDIVQPSRAYAIDCLNEIERSKHEFFLQHLHV